jgi:hypothetical protein
MLRGVDKHLRSPQAIVLKRPSSSAVSRFCSGSQVELEQSPPVAIRERNAAKIVPPYFCVSLCILLPSPIATAIEFQDRITLNHKIADHEQQFFSQRTSGHYCYAHVRWP